MPPERPYLVASVEESQRQINRRLAAKPSSGSWDSFPDVKIWHTDNIALLNRLFTTSEITDNYNAVIKKATSENNYSATEGSAHRACAAFLKELAAGITLYSPPPSNRISSDMQDPRTLAPAPIDTSITSGKWEFGTIEVETPGRDNIKYAPLNTSGTGVVKGMFNMEKTLEMLAMEGWDIFAVLPSYQETSHNSILTSSYRLFFKRQARPDG